MVPSRKRFEKELKKEWNYFRIEDETVLLEKRRFASVLNNPTVNGMVNLFLAIPPGRERLFEIEFIRMTRRLGIEIHGCDESLKLISERLKMIGAAFEGKISD